MANLDPFHQRLVNLSLQLGEIERMAEALGFQNTAIKLQDMRASVNTMADKVMTKIEAAHIARLQRRQHLLDKKDFGSKKIVPPSSQKPGERVAHVGDLSLTQAIGFMQQAGMHVHVIDENTDFSKLPVPGRQECQPDTGVESPQQCDAPNDQPPSE